jgi:hypothetical protein
LKQGAIEFYQVVEVNSINNVYEPAIASAFAIECKSVAKAAP